MTVATNAANFLNALNTVAGMEEVYGDRYQIAQDGPIVAYDAAVEVLEKGGIYLLNLTQHQSTKDQVDYMVGEIEIDRKEVSDLLTVKEFPTFSAVAGKALGLAELAVLAADEAGIEPTNVLVSVGGLPYLMSPLVEELKERGFTPVYSFTQRVSVDKDNGDGTVTKTNIFKHEGWYMP